MEFHPRPGFLAFATATGIEIAASVPGEASHGGWGLDGVLNRAEECGSAHRGDTSLLNDIDIDNDHDNNGSHVPFDIGNGSSASYSRGEGKID